MRNIRIHSILQLLRSYTQIHIIPNLYLKISTGRIVDIAALHKKTAHQANRSSNSHSTAIGFALAFEAFSQRNADIVQRLDFLACNTQYTLSAEAACLLHFI